MNFLRLLILFIFVALFVSCERTVSEVYKDTKEKPVISLIGSKNQLVKINSKYVDPGAKAVDKEEGDISQKIVVSGEVNTEENGTYELRYNVIDLAGNSAEEVIRIIKIENYTPPRVMLKGYNTMYVPYKSSFVDPGVVAYDNNNDVIDSEIIITTGKVNVNIPGEYILFYKVIIELDEYEVEASTKRTVIVSEDTKTGCWGGTNDYFEHGEYACNCSSGLKGSIYLCSNGTAVYQFELGVLCISPEGSAYHGDRCPRYTADGKCRTERGGRFEVELCKDQTLP